MAKRKIQLRARCEVYKGLSMLISCCLFLQVVTAQEHPRGLVKASQVENLRKKLRQPVFASFYQALQKYTDSLAKDIDITSGSIVQVSDLAYCQSFLYLFTGSKDWSDACWKNFSKVITDTVYFNKPFSRGLNRATLLRNVAIAYDLCYPAWTEAQRIEANEKILQALYSVSSNMGVDANYNIESNWMGIQYSSCVIASLVADKGAALSDLVFPIQWEATKRMQEHLDKNVYADGWNAESMSYFGYGWSFIGPALAMLQNRTSGANFSIEKFAPQVVESLHAVMTATASIGNERSRGIQADLSDDDPMVDPAIYLANGFALYPADQKAALKWMFHYFYPSVAEYSLLGMALPFFLLYYPQEISAANPATLGWKQYHSSVQGLVMVRNQFKDANDIVYTVNATGKRVHGHQGPDANTFRLIGLNEPWIIGGGRTNRIDGQSNMFPQLIETKKEFSSLTGALQDFSFQASGLRYAILKGSNTGVHNLRRWTNCSFDTATGASAVIAIIDYSSNGARWRINTPGFLQYQPLNDGYILTSPSGAKMIVHFPLMKVVKQETGFLGYGGDTKLHNKGIAVHGKSWEHSRYIDVWCQGNILAIITLVTANEEPPKVIANKALQTITVGAYSFSYDR